MKKQRSDSEHLMSSQENSRRLMESIAQDKAGQTKNVVESDFANTVKTMRDKKTALYQKIEAQANLPSTREYYSQQENGFSDIDSEVYDD